MTARTAKENTATDKAPKQPPKPDRHNQGTSEEFEREGMGVAAKE